MSTIEIDQSGKWESATHTVIGISIGNRIYSSMIAADSKKTIQSVLGGFEQERNRSKKKLIIRMFTYSVFLAVRDLARDGDIIMIDVEYQGNEESIRDLLLHLFLKFKGLKLNHKSIQFGHVGKTSLAHEVAHQTFTYKKSPDRILRFEDYFELLDRTVEIRKRALLRRKLHRIKRS